MCGWPLVGYRGGVSLALQISLDDLIKVTAADFMAGEDAVDRDRTFQISTDTRSIGSGDLFLALKGDRFDGHQFTDLAMEEGAAGVIVQSPVSTKPQLLVQDTLVAYQAVARWWRQKLGTPIVAITGSVGKTTTKELIAAVLTSSDYRVLKTEANYNNEIGVPKTLMGLSSNHDFGVIEMGMRGPGQIALLADIAQPNVAVITNVGTAHIELLGSEQAIANAKCELVAGLSADGIAVLNQDNDRLMRTAEGVWSGRTISYGLTGGDIHGKLTDAHHVEVNGIRLPLPLPGEHNASNFLAAIAVMEAFNLDWHSLQKGISVKLPGGRSSRITLPNDVVLLDETYNAGVESMQAALRLLKQTPGQRHIAVLGTMKELGDHSIDLHERVGRTVQQLKLDALFTLADPAETDALRTGAGPVPVESFDDYKTLQSRLADWLQPGDRVLFKASRAIALDRVVNGLQQELSQQSSD